MTCHKQMLEELQSQGLRLTAQRALILEDLYHNPGHRTAEDIFVHVSERLPGLNRATVYRTLEMLHHADVLTTFAGPQGVTEFELVRTSHDQHHHLVCRNCGAEEALDPGPVEALKAEIRRRHGFEAGMQHLVISGLCARCLAEQTQPDAPAHSVH
jgi:Fur family transcriptional regulator, ferric uptake regulator